MCPIIPLIHRSKTVEIWTKLGIDSAAIRSIGGRNTFEEMQQVKEIWSELPGKKVGLLTSALHLPRAVRLAGHKVWR